LPAASKASRPDATPGRGLELAGAALHPGCIHELGKALTLTRLGDADTRADAELLSRR